MVRFNHKGVNVSRWKRFWRGRSAHWFECVSPIDDGVEQAGIWELSSPDRNENLFMYPLQIVKALGAANYFVVNICTVIAGSDHALKFILSARMMIILQELTVQKDYGAPLTVRSYRIQPQDNLVRPARGKRYAHRGPF